MGRPPSRAAGGGGWPWVGRPGSAPPSPPMLGAQTAAATAVPVPMAPGYPWETPRLGAPTLGVPAVPMAPVVPMAGRVPTARAPRGTALRGRGRRRGRRPLGGHHPAAASPSRRGRRAVTHGRGLGRREGGWAGGRRAAAETSGTARARGHGRRSDGRSVGRSGRRAAARNAAAPVRYSAAAGASAGTAGRWRLRRPPPGAASRAPPPPRCAPPPHVGSRCRRPKVPMVGARKVRRGRWPGARRPGGGQTPTSCTSSCRAPRSRLERRWTCLSAFSAFNALSGQIYIYIYGGDRGQTR